MEDAVDGPFAPLVEEREHDTSADKSDDDDQGDGG